MRHQHQKNAELPKTGQRGTTDQELPQTPGREDKPNARRAHFVGESATSHMVENPQQADANVGGDFARHEKLEKDPASTENAPPITGENVTPPRTLKGQKG